MDDLMDIIMSVVNQSAAFDRLPVVKKRLFCTGLALVTLGLRGVSAYLIDVIAPPEPEPVFSALLTKLRSRFAAFQAVVHLFDTTCYQSYFVNTTLIYQRLVNAANVHYVYIQTDSLYSLLNYIPATLQETLELLTPHFNPSKLHHLPSLSVETSGPEVSVPLAAVLLEYPVAYVPKATVTTFFHDIPLDVYECTLTIDSQLHPLLRFSCPVDIGKTHEPLSPDGIQTALQMYFRPRLHDFDHASLQVVHHVETHDRVAM